MSNSNQKKRKISIANLVGIIILFMVIAFDLLIFLGEDISESDVVIDMTTTDYDFKDWQNDGFEGRAIAYFRVTCPNTVTKYSTNSTTLTIYPGLEGYDLNTWIVERNGNVSICNWDWMDFDWLCENTAGTKLYVGTFELCDKEVPGYDAYFNITDVKAIAESDLERVDFNDSFEVKTDGSKEEMVTETSETDDLASTEVEVEKEDSVPVPVDPSEFCGEWYDMNNQTCWMEIVCENDVLYDVRIHWSDSVSDITCCSFVAEFDSKKNALTYTNGCCYSEYYGEDLTPSQEEIYSGGTGSIFMEDGKLFWQDDKGAMGADFVFVRAEEKNSSYETETSTVNLKWYCTDKWFYNAETGSWLEVIYYDDGSLEFAVDGLTVIYYSATGMYGDSYTVSGTSIEYVCNSSNGGTRVCYDSAFAPSITISGSAGYDGNYFLQQ